MKISALSLLVFLSLADAHKNGKKGTFSKKTKKQKNQGGHMGRKYKNIIMLIPDGSDEGVLGLARWYKNEPLQVDDLASGRIHPYMANSLMTDSAPGGTAYSSGQLTTDKFIAVGPRREDLLSNLNPSDLWEPYAPIPTNLEAAKALGMSTGVLATSRITHATPGAFTAHVDDRSKEEEIAKQMVFNNIDVVMGGGRKNMLPAEECFPSDGIPEVTGARTDCLDLEKELEHRGYNLCYTKEELLKLDGKKAWCSFASSHMAPDIDRQWIAETEPSLSEMTEKAIEILSQNDEGFFLMVEGSQVDWAGHANDPIWMVTDFIAWDDSVKIAVDWAKENEDTLVLALPDHNTGGVKVGNYKFEYLDRTIEFAREPLLKMKMTSEAVVEKMENKTSAESMKVVVKEHWGIELTDKEANTIMEYSDKYSVKYDSQPQKDDVIPLNYALSRVVSEEYTIAGWTTHGHTGEDVPMWVYGMEPPRTTIRNIEVGLIVAELLGGLDELNKRLYVDLDTSNLEYEVNTDDETNLHAIVEGFVFPLNTDYFLNAQGERVMTSGLTVYAPMTKKLYMSEGAIDMVKEMI